VKSSRFFTFLVATIATYIFSVVAIAQLPESNPLMIRLGCSLVIIALMVWALTENKLPTAISTDLPRSGTIKGPEHGLPSGVVLEYSDAAHSPIITIFDNGFNIDFGNGIVSIISGNTSISHCSGIKVSLSDSNTGSYQSIS